VGFEQGSQVDGKLVDFYQSMNGDKRKNYRFLLDGVWRMKNLQVPIRGRL